MSTLQGSPVLWCHGHAPAVVIAQMHRCGTKSTQVAKLEGKGKGLVATRKAAAGDLLLQEYPLMVIDGEDNEVGVPIELRLNLNALLTGLK